MAKKKSMTMEEALQVILASEEDKAVVRAGRGSLDNFLMILKWCTAHHYAAASSLGSVSQ